MVRALGSASSKDHVGDSGLGEEQCDPQACQSFLPQNTGQSRHQPSPATVEHFGTAGNEEDDIESVIDSEGEEDTHHHKQGAPPAAQGQQCGEKYTNWKKTDVIDAV